MDWICELLLLIGFLMDIHYWTSKFEVILKLSRSGIITLCLRGGFCYIHNKLIYEHKMENAMVGLFSFFVIRQCSFRLIQVFRRCG